MGKENKETYKQIRSDLEARIVYEDFDGECFKKDEDGNFNGIVLVSMPDDGGCTYEDCNGDEHFIPLNEIRLTDEKYQRMLEIKQTRGW